LIDLPIWVGLTVKDQNYIIENLRDIVKKMDST